MGLMGMLGMMGKAQGRVVYGHDKLLCGGLFLSQGLWWYDSSIFMRCYCSISFVALYHDCSAHSM